MVSRPFLPPFQDGRYWLGTDMLGRDIFAGLAHGAQVSLIVGFVSTLVALGVGILFGALAGYYGGLIDDALMRVTEFFQTIPTFIFALLLVAIFNPSVTSIIVALGIVSWPPVARLVRSEFASLRSREFVKAAIVLGQSNRQIIFSQILPNTMSPVIAMASLMVATAILQRSRDQLPRPGRPQPHELGLYDRRLAHGYPAGMVDEFLPRDGHPARGAGAQPGGRRR